MGMRAVINNARKAFNSWQVYFSLLPTLPLIPSMTKATRFCKEANSLAYKMIQFFPTFFAPPIARNLMIDSDFA